MDKAEIDAMSIFARSLFLQRYLINLRDAEGKVRKSQLDMVAETGLTEKQAQKCLTILAALEVLEKVHNGNKFAPSTYIVNTTEITRNDYASLLDRKIFPGRPRITTTGRLTERLLKMHNRIEELEKRIALLEGRNYDNS